MIEVRGGCSVRRRTSQLETRWYQHISRILLRHLEKVQNNNSSLIGRQTLTSSVYGYQRAGIEDHTRTEHNLSEITGLLVISCHLTCNSTEN